MKNNMFRGKRIDNNKWAYGSLVIFGSNEVYIFNPENLKGSVDKWIKSTKEVFIGIDGFAGVDPKTVGQYTKLKDKNNKKIYNGDIVRISLSFKAIGKVRYEKGMWVVYLPASWVILSTSSAKLEAFPLWQFVVDDRAEVIGNIYDNPELIGDKNG